MGFGLCGGAARREDGRLLVGYGGGLIVRLDMEGPLRGAGAGCWSGLGDEGGSGGGTSGSFRLWWLRCWYGSRRGV